MDVMEFMNGYRKAQHEEDYDDDRDIREDDDEYGYFPKKHYYNYGYDEYDYQHDDDYMIAHLMME